MKICVIGYSGSGKSTLEFCIWMPSNWLPNWTMRTSEEKNRIVGEFLDTHNSCFETQEGLSGDEHKK